MNGTEGFGRSLELKRMIEAEQERLAMLRTLATKTTRSPERDPGGGGTDRMTEEILAAIEELQQRIDRHKAELLSLQLELVQTMQDRCSAREQQVLQARYIGMKSWEEIALSLDLSVSSVMRIHRYAMRRFEPAA